MIMNEVNPIISVACLAYNHEKFIRDTLEGFLLQRTSFSFEIIIHDDASTDGTIEIIKEYVLKYPHLITAIFQDQNQYSKYGNSIFIEFVLPKIRSKYIAMCEGDDYWTDPLKLQKQVEFLEANPDYTASFGGFTQLNVNTNETFIIIKKIKNNDNEKNGFSFSLEEMQKSWITKTLTAVYRKCVLDKIDFTPYKYTRDIHLFYHLIRNYKGFYFTENFGIYRIHEGGVNSMKKGMVNSNVAYKCYKELYEHNKDEFTRVLCRNHTLGLLNYNLYNKYPGNTLGKLITLFFEAVRLTKKLSEVKNLLYVFIPAEMKEELKTFYKAGMTQKH